MELTQLNSINNVSNIQNNSKVNNLQSTKEVVEKYPIDNVVINNSDNSGTFLSNISSNVMKIANLQKIQSSVTNQLEITNEIVKTTNLANNSNQIQLDDKQPEIKNLIDNFNIISKGTNTTEISDKTGIYFDGQVGAKPLSVNEIHEAVDQQKERLEQFSKKVDSQIESVIADTKNNIKSEKMTVETKVEFKNIDYEKESMKFSSETLDNVKGGVLPSQANAFPSHSEKLLA